MSNPWESIPLSDYENHMKLDSVRQLQAMNQIMHSQFEAYPVKTAMILGVAGGNGLEHICRQKYDTVYGIDINADYLAATAARFPELEGCLQCLKMDLITEAALLPKAELVIANLLIEYIGYPAFQTAILKISPKYVSCVIQINLAETAWVSDSPYLHTFDHLDEVHHAMSAKCLTQAMEEIGYRPILQCAEPLPNGKQLLRLDYQK